MTHWHDPAVLTLEEGSSGFFFRSWLSTYVALLGSCFDQVYARHRWCIYVSYIYLTFGWLSSLIQLGIPLKPRL